MPVPSHPPHGDHQAVVHTTEHALERLASLGLTEDLCESGTVSDNRDQRNPDSVQQILKRKSFESEDMQELSLPFSRLRPSKETGLQK